MLALLFCAMAAMGALHLLRPDLSVIHQPLSFYVHGPHGWLLPVALMAFGGAGIVLGLSVRVEFRVSLASNWLIYFGAGMLLAAIAPADPWFLWEGPVSLLGAVHATVAVVAPPLLIGAMAELRRRRSGLTRPRKILLDAFAFAYLVGLGGSGVSLLAGFLQDTSPPFIGLAERVLALAAVAWLPLVACIATRER